MELNMPGTNYKFVMYHSELERRWAKHIKSYSVGVIDCGCVLCKIFHQARKIHVALENIEITYYWKQIPGLCDPAECRQDKRPFFKRHDVRQTAQPLDEGDKKA